MHVDYVCKTSHLTGKYGYVGKKQSFNGLFLFIIHVYRVSKSTFTKYLNNKCSSARFESYILYFN